MGAFDAVGMEPSNCRSVSVPRMDAGCTWMTPSLIIDVNGRAGRQVNGVLYATFSSGIFTCASSRLRFFSGPCSVACTSVCPGHIRGLFRRIHGKQRLQRYFLRI